MNAKHFIAIILGAMFAFLSTPSFAQESNFEIIKATENVAWRLNKKTGEISACRFSGDTMTCASSDTAVVRPKTTLEALKKERKKERLEMQSEDMAMLDRLFTYFKKMIGSVKKLERDLNSEEFRIESEKTN